MLDNARNCVHVVSIRSIKAFKCTLFDQHVGITLPSCVSSHKSKATNALFWLNPCMPIDIASTHHTSTGLEPMSFSIKPPGRYISLMTCWAISLPIKRFDSAEHAWSLCTFNLVRTLPLRDVYLPQLATYLQCIPSGGGIVWKIGIN